MAGACVSSCDCCGRELPPGADAIEAKADELLSACEALGIAITFDLYVNECDAAALLGKSRHTLRNRRAIDRPIAFRKLGRTPQYSLTALARHIVSGADIE